MRKKLTILGLLMLVVLAAKTNCFAGNLLGQSDFSGEEALPWTIVQSASGVATGKIANGEYVLTIKNPGANKEDVQFKHSGLTLQKGHTYQVKFKIRSAVDNKVYVRIGDAKNEYWSNNGKAIELTGEEEKVVDQTFVMTGDTNKNVEFSLQFGGELAGVIYPFIIAIDDVYLLDEEFTPTYRLELAPPPDIVLTGWIFPTAEKSYIS